MEDLDYWYATLLLCDGGGLYRICSALRSDVCLRSLCYYEPTEGSSFCGGESRYMGVGRFRG